MTTSVYSLLFILGFHVASGNVGILLLKKKKGIHSGGELAASVTNGDSQFHIHAEVHEEAEAQIKKKLVFRVTRMGVDLQQG